MNTLLLTISAGLFVKVLLVDNVLEKLLKGF